MAIEDISGTSCAFIPVYCYYDRAMNGEVKTPILLMNPESFLLTALILEIDPSIFTVDELKDQFVEAYYSMGNTIGNEKALDTYDIYPQLVNVLHTDEEEISIYVCELYENSEPYFKKMNRSKVADAISYKQSIDDLIQGGVLESLTEKILISLSEEKYITSNNEDKGSSSIELF